MDYRNTLNLPSTEFPMRANLAKREPDILKYWDELDIYQKIRESKKDNPPFVLHDGPPYANGNIHLGTALNKILKDLVNKSQLLLGKSIHYRPGWDCHGLPIELNVTQAISEEEKSTITTLELRRRCRNYALKFVEKHKKSFKRLGVIGDFERPYLTLAPSYEAEELRLFATFAEKGLVYQGLKPIYWCSSCSTALAEAEVEYDDHTSPSIYVRFPLTDVSSQKVKKEVSGLEDKPIKSVIWTTTPWTLPANRAVCLHPNFIYTLIPLQDEYLLIAKDLVDRFLSDSELEKSGNTIGSFTGKELADLGIEFHHPLSDRVVPLIYGTHVTLEQGTGCVHTAPGHGHEDYLIGLEFGLEIFSPVDKHGCLTEESPVCHGHKVSDANKPIMNILDEKTLLVSHKSYQHSYPHCWRCKNPIIFRSTRQWFISLEKENLRNRLLEAIDNKVNWIPQWGKQRIRGMVENRQEWCISRQRSWGVPIPAIYIGESEEGLLDAQLIRELSEVIAKEGTNFWYTAMEDKEQLKRLPRLEQLLPDGMTVEYVHLEKDILDVWFDSGVSHQSVMKQDEGIFPVDMYLEGSDQHRGWFQSSLVSAIGTDLEPPYKTVLTHGFTVDEKGKKLSKSLGNYVDLDKVIGETGADVIRLWVAAEDFRGDMTFSKEILTRMTESYRRIRNTIRFLLGNLNGYQPDQFVPEEDRLDIDRWILSRWNESKSRIIHAYERHDFHRIFYELNNFCSVDLSAQYLDIIKDRLYVFGEKNKDRKACQATLAKIVVELTSCTAPILSFTCEEAWKFLQEMDLVQEESVFLYEIDKTIPETKTEFMEWWDKIFQLRGDVIKVIEQARKSGVIGHPLDCRVYLNTDDPQWKAILEEAQQKKDGNTLASIFIVSDVTLEPMPNPEKGEKSLMVPAVTIAVDKAPGEKCPRCWHYDEAVDEENNVACSRCQKVIAEENFTLTE